MMNLMKKEKLEKKSFEKMVEEEIEELLNASIYETFFVPEQSKMG